MAGEVIHGFGEDGELSRGAELALDAYWATRMPLTATEGQILIWSDAEGKWIAGDNTGGGGGGISFTDLGNGYMSGTGVSVTDLGNGYSNLTGGSLVDLGNGYSTIT